MNEEQAKARLVDERSATVERLAAMTSELSAVADAAAGSNLDDEHDPEGSTVAFEREQLAALRSHAEAQLQELDAALARLADHRYGYCESCGSAIGDERLEVLPATRLCVTCAAHARRYRGQ